MSTSQLSVYFFLQGALIIFVAYVIGRLAARFGQPVVVGEMIAGVALGPSLFGLVAPGLQKMIFPKDTLGVLYVVAQLGVGLYMFLVGCEFRSEHLRKNIRSALAVSLSGVLVPFLLAGAIIPWLHDVPGLFAPRTKPAEATLFLGAAIAITAFPMLARIIHERSLAGTPLGTLALTAGASDDAISWCILAIVLASFGGSWIDAWMAIGGGITFILVFSTIGKRMLSMLLPQIDEEKEIENGHFAKVLVLFCLAAFAMDAVGIHAVFGGFILGCAMPRGPRTQHLCSSLQPVVVVLLLPMFFTYSGLNTRLDMLIDPSILMAAVLVLAASFCGKLGACWAAARLSGLPNTDALAIGALMNARGLMELIIINIGLTAGVILPGLFSVLVLMAVLSTILATPLFNFFVRARKLA